MIFQFSSSNVSEQIGQEYYNEIFLYILNFFKSYERSKIIYLFHQIVHQYFNTFCIRIKSHKKKFLDLQQIYPIKQVYEFQITHKNDPYLKAFINYGFVKTILCIQINYKCHFHAKNIPNKFYQNSQILFKWQFLVIQIVFIKQRYQNKLRQVFLFSLSHIFMINPSLNDRFETHPCFNTNEVIVNCIKVDNQILYYQPQEKIQILQKQFQTFTGKILKLSTKNISIPNDMKIEELLGPLEKKQTFQLLINQIQQKDIVSVKISNQNIQYVNNCSVIKKICKSQEKSFIQNNSYEKYQKIKQQQKKIQQPNITLKEKNISQQKVVSPEINIPWYQKILIQEMDISQQKAVSNEIDIQQQKVVSPEMNIPWYQKILLQEMDMLQQKITLKQYKIQQKNEDIVQNQNKIISKNIIYQQKTCKISVTNIAESSKQFNLSINKQKTIRNIIQQASKFTQCQLSFIEVIVDNGNFIQPIKFHLTLQQLKIDPRQIIINYLSSSCYFKGTSTTFFKGNKGYQTYTIHKSLKDSIRSSDSKQLNKKSRVSSYNKCLHRLQQSQICHFKQLKNVISYIKLSFKGQGQTLQLECGPGVFLMNDKFQWICCKFVKIGQTYCCCSKSYELQFFSIINIQNIEINKQASQKEENTFYSLSQENNHNLVINRIIVHNRNSFSVNVLRTKNGSYTRDKMNVYADNKLKDIFGNAKCFLGGLQLNNQHTFGDYQVSKFDFLYVIDSNSYQSQSIDQITISEFNGLSTNYNTNSLQQINRLKSKWRQNYLGIFKSSIVSPKDIDVFLNKKQPVNILIGIRGNFERINYIKNIQPKFIHNENKLYQKYIKYSISGKPIDQKACAAIRLYTGNQIYRDLNQFLNVDYSNLSNMSTHQEWISIASWINKSLRKVACVAGTFFRGMKNINIKTAFGLSSNNQTIILKSFTSTSMNINVAHGFSNANGGILTFKLRTGRQISQYSCYQGEKQVLIPPFTYFVINNFNQHSQPQTIELEQIPMPESDADKIVFWVDDQPNNNRFIIENCLKPKGIEVVEIISTRIMLIILKKFFWMFKMIGKKIVIISDMSRFEDGAWNYTAGVDLFNKIYMEYGLSNKAIIYTGNKQKALQHLKNRGVTNQTNWMVSIDQNEVIKEVFKQFGL